MVIMLAYNWRLTFQKGDLFSADPPKHINSQKVSSFSILFDFRQGVGGLESSGPCVLYAECKPQHSVWCHGCVTIIVDGCQDQAVERFQFSCYFLFAPKS